MNVPPALTDTVPFNTTYILDAADAIAAMVRVFAEAELFVKVYALEFAPVTKELDPDWFTNDKYTMLFSVAVPAKLSEMLCDVAPADFDKINTVSIS